MRVGPFRDGSIGMFSRDRSGALNAFYANFRTFGYKRWRCPIPRYPLIIAGSLQKSLESLQMLLPKRLRQNATGEIIDHGY